ncbi:MAG TPA: hypothetical protein ENN43_08170 [bacterium]|nr:hypothetical protein [bacterium]
MPAAKHFFILFLICNNILIFFAGVYLQAKASFEHDELVISCTLDSALPVALQAFEDRQAPDSVKGSVEVNNRTAVYTAEKTPDNRLYLRVTVDSGNKEHVREYIINHL